MSNILGRITELHMHCTGKLFWREFLSVGPAVGYHGDQGSERILAEGEEVQLLSGAQELSQCLHE